jgi:hypothetical protein
VAKPRKEEPCRLCHKTSTTNGRSLRSCSRHLRGGCRVQGRYRYADDALRRSTSPAWLTESSQYSRGEGMPSSWAYGTPHVLCGSADQCDPLSGYRVRCFSVSSGHCEWFLTNRCVLKESESHEKEAAKFRESHEREAAKFRETECAGRTDY